MRGKGAFMTEVLETLLANRERVRIRSLERGDWTTSTFEAGQGGSDN